MNLFTVDEVNSNISSNSSIKKITRDFPRSIHDPSRSNESAIEGHRSRKSCQLLSPVKITEQNPDDERKIRSEYIPKGYWGYEPDASSPKSYKSRSIITR